MRETHPLRPTPLLISCAPFPHDRATLSVFSDLIVTNSFHQGPGFLVARAGSSELANFEAQLSRGRCATFTRRDAVSEAAAGSSG
jgi:hypothetical protein